MNLPVFKYHPNPIATGYIKPSDAQCECCGQRRGFIYIGPVYSAEELSKCICPWCIADGSAAKRYDASFCDDHNLRKADLAEDIIVEVTQRTPGYTSWQGEQWQSCCNDACEFHGDLSREELQSLSGLALDRFLNGTGWDAAHLPQFTKNYQPGSSPAIYKFVCRHCKQPSYYSDCD